MLKEIGQVAVFIICAQTLLHFRAKESYEKYVKLLISMMVLLLLLKPFFNGGFGKEGDVFAEMVTRYENEIGKEMLLAETDEGKVEDIVMSMAQEAVLQEEMQETALTQEESSAESMEKKGKEPNIIQVETIRIGEQE